jgi:uncharacterized protein YifE (UPF0438 family)
MNWTKKLLSFKESAIVYQKDEFDFILKHAKDLEEFTQGKLASRMLSEKEQHFLDVALGKSEPVTEKEHLWAKFQNLISRAEYFENAETGKLSNFPAVKALQGQLERYKLESENKEKEINRLSSRIRHLENKYEPETSNEIGKTNICTVCHGDGGINSGCYKCNGNGLI